MAIDRDLAIISLFLLMLTYIWMSVLFLKARKKSPENPILLSFILIFLFFFAGRLILGIFDFYLTILDSSRFPEFIWWWKIGELVHNMGFVVLCFVVERQLFEGRDRYVFFIGFLASITIMIAMPDVESAEWFTGIGLLFSFFIPVGLARIAWITNGEMRRRVIYAFVGFMIFMFSGLIVGEIPVSFFGTVTGWSRYAFHFFSNCGQILASCLFARGYL